MQSTAVILMSKTYDILSEAFKTISNDFMCK